MRKKEPTTGDQICLPLEINELTVVRHRTYDGPIALSWPIHPPRVHPSLLRLGLLRKGGATGRGAS